MRILCLCLALATTVAAARQPAHPAPSGPTVQLTNGKLAGMQQGNIAVFMGIPFAAPPVGNLRWRPPQPAAAWAGVRDATKASHPCMQNVGGTDNFMAPQAATYGVSYVVQPVDPSEDCLYLNVWTTRHAAKAHLPVMVWLHGGSNRVGSGIESGYDGSSLALRGVVIVTINYRLGAMGFFAHPELTAESPHHSSGNYGLLDQIAALEWVKQNITQFGGDPANVTLFGESAGGIDATVLMTSPLANGLFQRVIAESGPAFGLAPEQTVAKMEGLGEALGKQAGGQPGAQISLLRKLPATKVSQLEDELIKTQFKGYDPNASIVDGWLLPQSPAKAFALGAILKADFLVGINAREFSAFRIAGAAAAKKLTPPTPTPGVSEQVKLFADTARPLYGDWTDIAVVSDIVKILLHGAAGLDQASNDIIGACPIGAEAALTASAGQRAYVYRFERTVPGKGEAELGAFHSLELPYVFGTFQARTFNWLPFDATDRKLSGLMQVYWTNFAKTGDPNGPGLPQWTAWTVANEPYMTFSKNGEGVPAENFSPMFCHLSPDRLKQQLVNY